MNNKLILGALVLLVVVAGGFYIMDKNSRTSAPVNTEQSTPATSGQNNVTIQNFSFSPKTLIVKAGDKVTWTNQDSMGHSATADERSFDTGVFNNGETKSITFGKAGSFAYHCSVHPSMTGTVVVQ